MTAIVTIKLQGKQKFIELYYCHQTQLISNLIPFKYVDLSTQRMYESMDNWNHKSLSTPVKCTWKVSVQFPQNICLHKYFMQIYLSIFSSCNKEYKFNLLLKTYWMIPQNNLKPNVSFLLINDSLEAKLPCC